MRLLRLTLLSTVTSVFLAAPAHATGSQDRSSCTAEMEAALRLFSEDWIFRRVKGSALESDRVRALSGEAAVADTPEKCADLLERLAAALGDGHVRLVGFSGVQPPTAPHGVAARRLGGGEVAAADDDFYLVSAPGLSGRDGESLRGARIVSIDGEAPVVLADRARERTSASTLTQREFRVDQRLLFGAPGSSLELVVEAPSGGRDTLVLERPGVPERPGMREPGVRGGPLEGGAAYIRIAHFDARTTGQEVQRLVSSFADAPALLLDVRGASDGSISAVLEVLRLFLDQWTSVGEVFRIHRGVDGAAAPTELSLRPRSWRWTLNPRPYEGKLLVLVDPGCFGACDFFAATLKSTGRALVVGAEPTGGGSAESARATPRGGTAAFQLPVLVAYRPGGLPLEGSPTRSDSPVRITARDYARDPDPLLTRAAALLRTVSEGVAELGEYRPSTRGGVEFMAGATRNRARGYGTRPILGVALRTALNQRIELIFAARRSWGTQEFGTAGTPQSGVSKSVLSFYTGGVAVQDLVGRIRLRGVLEGGFATEQFTSRRASGSLQGRDGQATAVGFGVDVELLLRRDFAMELSLRDLIAFDTSTLHFPTIAVTVGVGLRR